MPLIPLYIQNELDTSDVGLDNIMSAFNWCNPFDTVLPFSTGTVTEKDKAHLWGLYTGIPVDGSSSGSSYVIFFRRRRM